VSGNVELAKRSFEAFLKGDVDAYVNSFAEDVEWDVSAYLTGRQEYSGREGVREFLADVQQLAEEQGERFVIEPTEFIEVPDGRVLALGTARIERPTDPLEFGTSTVYTFGEDGLISRLVSFTSHEEGRREIGLPEDG
jgi:ketosteroid isomerase-like protein